MIKMRVSAAPQTRQSAGRFRIDQFGVDQQRQRRHVALERVEVDRPAVADEHQHRRRLAHDPGKGQQDAGDRCPATRSGRTMRAIVFHFGMPSAYDASRSSSGTSFSISSVLRTTTGSISSTSASDTAKRDSLEAERRDPQRVDEQRGDDRRHTGEDVDHEGGDLAEPAAAVLDQVDGDQDADRHGDDRADQACISVP